MYRSGARQQQCLGGKGSVNLVHNMRDTTQLPRDLVLFYSFSANRPLVLQNEAETPTYPRTVEEYTIGKGWHLCHC